VGKSLSAEETDMRQTTQIPLTLTLFVFCVFFVWPQPPGSVAGTWTDNFNDGNLDGWTRPSDSVKDKHWDAIWQSKDEVLDVIIQPNGRPMPKDWENKKLNMTHDFLELTAFPISASKLTVEAIPFQGVGIGIALGNPPTFFDGIGTFYTFTRTDVWHMALFPNGEGFELPLNPPIKGDILFGEITVRPIIPPGQPMKVVFESGRFQVFSQGQLLVEFVDEDYPKIELVGIYAQQHLDVHVSRKKLDDFLIFGPNLAVSPRGKLATTWGDVKNGKHGSESGAVQQDRLIIEPKLEEVDALRHRIHAKVGNSFHRCPLLASVSRAHRQKTRFASTPTDSRRAPRLQRGLLGE
jgi:hypothetical protein